MVDPVIAADSFTYERDALKRWIGMGEKKNSPMNPMIKLDPKAKLVTNLLAGKLASKFDRVYPVKLEVVVRQIPESRHF